MKTKLTLALLALLLAARLGASDFSLQITGSISGTTTDPRVVTASLSVTSINAADNYKPTRNSIGNAVKITSDREPIVTRTADGWTITFKEAAAAKPEPITERTYTYSYPVHPVVTSTRSELVNVGEVWRYEYNINRENLFEESYIRDDEVLAVENGYVQYRKVGTTYSHSSSIILP